MYMSKSINRYCCRIFAENLIKLCISHAKMWNSLDILNIIVEKRTAYCENILPFAFIYIVNINVLL